MTRKELIKRLVRELGEDVISTDEAEKFCYAFDFSIHKCLPDAVALPKNTKQVSALLKLANKMSIPVVPRGGGTGTVGGALALNGGVVTDLSRMDKIKEIDKKNLTMTCEAGVTIDQINRVLHRQGFFFPMEMDGLAGIIGGYIACNGTGIHSVKFGKMRDWVRALEVVLPNGEILRTGVSAPVSSNPDLTHLFIGTEGTLGIITEATFGILLLPEKKMSGIVSVDTLEKAGKIMSRILREGSIADLMVYDDLPLKSMRKRLAHPKAKAMLKVTLIGKKEEVNRYKKDINQIISSFHPIKTEWFDIAKDPLQTSNIFDMAAIIPGARPVHIAEDIAVPVSELSEALVGIKAIAKKYGIPTLVISGDVGKGVLHPALLINVRKKEQFDKAKKVMEGIYRLALKLGGTISGTHGVGISRSRYMKLEHKEPYLKTFASIKKALDAKNILNPGKMGLSPVPNSFENILFSEWWQTPKTNSLLEKYRDSIITCDFCGFCNIVCPIFLKKKWHSFSPRGRLLLARGLLTGEVKITAELKRRFSTCTLCGLCDKNCPKGIPISKIIECAMKSINL